MPANLTAEQLALLRQLAAQLAPYQADTSSGYGDASNYTAGQNQSKWSSWDPSQAVKSYGVQMGPNGPVFAGDTGDGTGYVYDQNGNFVRAEDRNDGHVGLINGFLTTAALGSLASGYGAGAESAATGGADASTSAAWSNGAGLGKDTLSAIGGSGGAGGAGMSGLGGAGGGMTAAEAWGSGAGLGGDTLSAGGANLGAGGYTSAAGGAAGSGAGSGGLWEAAKSVVSPAVSALTSGNGSTLAGLLGAGLGALSEKDTTTSKDPWAPAQPWIKQNIADGQALQAQYKAQPFNQAQQTSYNNIGGLLNAMNQMAPTMMQGFSNNASGANQFSRSNPTRSLLGTDVMKSGATWNPGLLNFFPQKG